jgi:ribonuclease-3
MLGAAYSPSTPMESREIAELFCIPLDGAHLEEALTHPSFTNEKREGRHYQRLEFLGDAVLELCASEALWRAFPGADEGELTRRRAQLVKAESLADFARKNGVPEALRLGRGAEATGLRTGTNVLADTVEALIAAAYLDAGFEAARNVCERIVAAGLAQAGAREDQDPKTTLQEDVQALGAPTPQYEVVESWGPAHERWFRVRVNVGQQSLAEGVGRSKRGAEREAAAEALRNDLSVILAEPIDAL